MKYLSLDGLKYFYNKYIGNLGDAAKQDVANNLTTTTAGKVLDARQGKALKDSVNKNAQGVQDVKTWMNAIESDLPVKVKQKVLSPNLSNSDKFDVFLGSEVPDAVFVGAVVANGTDTIWCTGVTRNAQGNWIGVLNAKQTGKINIWGFAIMLSER